MTTNSHSTERLEVENALVALSPKQFAQRFGRHPTWAYRLLYAGRIQKIDYPGRILIPISELDRFANATIGHE